MELVKNIISVAGMTATEIMEKWDKSKGTAYRALKQGWIIPEYQTKTVNVGNIDDIDIENLQRIVTAVFCRFFSSQGPEIRSHREDLYQEAILRCLELSGISQDKFYFYKISQNAMRSYLQKWHLLGKKREVKGNESRFFYNKR